MKIHLSRVVSKRFDTDTQATTATACGKRSKSWVGVLQHTKVTCPDCIEDMRRSDNLAENDGRKRKYGTTR